MDSLDGIGRVDPFTQTFRTLGVHGDIVPLAALGVDENGVLFIPSLIGMFLLHFHTHKQKLTLAL